MGVSIESNSTGVETAEEPALVVSFGATTNKRRPLVKHATLIGRNRGCDLRLDAPEVSGIHCIISRHSTGLTLRDCDTRGGVLVNGQPTRETDLRDGDSVQIGPFSFVVSIPLVPSVNGASHPADMDDAARKKTQEFTEQNKCLQHHIASVETERDRLAAQLNQARADLAARESSLRGEEALARKIESLQAEIHAIESSTQSLSTERDQLRAELDSHRSESLTKAEAADAAFDDRLVWMEREIEEITGDRDRLRADIEVIHHSSRQISDEFAGLRKVHDELQRRWEALSIERDELEKKFQAIDAEHQIDKERATAANVQLAEVQERLRQSEQERDRLQQVQDVGAAEKDQAHRAALEAAHGEAEAAKTRAEEQIRRQMERLQEQENSWKERVDQLTAERDALEEKLAAAESTSGHALSDDIAHFQDQLGQLAKERDSLRAELEDLRLASSSMVSIKIDALQEEMNEVVGRLKQAEAERADVEKRLAAEHEQNEQRLAILRKQLDQERMQLKQLVIQAAKQHDRTQTEMESLRAQLSGFHPADVAAEDEMEQLKRRIAELESQNAPGQEALPTDLAAYEAQLNQYRADLETAQEDLQGKERELERQRDEVFEKLKQTELELSRERAAIARERAEIERIRREYLAEMEHAQREAQTRAKLAPVDQLAQEVKGRNQDAPPPSTLSVRLMSLIRRANDAEK